MSTETANLIVACASLVVMVVTFFFTFKMYVYMKKVLLAILMLTVGI